MQVLDNYSRYCPDEEHIKISDAVCFGRRRRHYPKCKGCQFNDDERARQVNRQVVVPGVTISSGGREFMDKVFKAYDVRGIYPDPLNEDAAWRIGFAVGTFLRGSLHGVDRANPEVNRVVVGRDMRKSSPSMADALIGGLRASSTGVVDIGMIDTPQLYFAVNHFACCGGIQTTASHNPANYNGFKICGRGGVPVGAETGLMEIQAIATNISVHKAKQDAEVMTASLTDAYRDFVLKPLDLQKPLSVVIDASNGMAGKWIPLLFDGVDDLTIDALHFETDGTFVHEPNPLVAANLQWTCDRVREIGADFGVCFDGDADRCMLVDEQGEIISCDLATALLADRFLGEHPDGTVVFDLRSSRIVSETIRRLGGTARRERVGHAFMKKAMAESKAVFGGELSGHFYFKDNWYCDSGALAFVHFLNVVSSANVPLSELIRPLRKYHASGELNFQNNHQDETIQALGTAFDGAEVDYLDGVTVQYPEWWFNVRKSNTEPLLRLNLEANTAELLEAKLDELRPRLGDPVDH